MRLIDRSGLYADSYLFFHGKFICGRLKGEVAVGQHILVYDNRTEIIEKMNFLFAQENIFVMVASDEKEFFQMLERAEAELVLLDVCLSETEWDGGMELIAKVRKCSKVPVMVVSEQSAETAKIMALEVGADDYVTADCNPYVLLARVKAQLRRYHQLIHYSEKDRQVYSVENLVIDDMQKKVMVDGRQVSLTPIEYKILYLLVRQRGKVLSNSQIYENIWKMKAYAADNTIAVHIRHIREKIEENPKEPKYLKVVWGSGYVVQ